MIRSNHILFFVVLALLSSLTRANSEKRPKQLKVYLMLSVDWEGDTLRESNLKAMADFNKKFSDYPVIHFLNAAYYTKKWDRSHSEITEQINRALKPNDEIGIHIHAWEEFVRASGVDYKNGPSFWNSPFSVGRNGEYGDDVPLNTYSKNEIRKMLSFSLDTLEAQGFKNIESFRGGGWMSGPKVFEALKELGLKIDSSAVPASLVENLYPDTHLAKINRRQWKGIQNTTSPYLQTPDIVQFPNNAGLADYLDEQEFFEVYLKNVQEALEAGKDEVYIHFGWHQESAVEYFERTPEGKMKLVRSNFLERVKKGLKKIEAHARDHNHILSPTDFKNYPKTTIRPLSPSSRNCRALMKGFLTSD